MYSLISLPLVPEVLAEYPGEGISDLCRSHGCQGVEGVWGGADLPLERLSSDLLPGLAGLLERGSECTRAEVWQHGKLALLLRGERGAGDIAAAL